MVYAPCVHHFIPHSSPPLTLPHIHIYTYTHIHTYTLFHHSEADFLRAIDSNLVGDTITLGVQRYIENGRTGREFGMNQGGARRAIETTLKLKLAQSGLTR